MGQSLQLPTERVILLEDGRTITDPTEETLIELLGYKPVIEEDEPSETPEGFYYVDFYEEDEEVIYRRWELKELPQIEIAEEPIYEEPVQEVSSFERFSDILLGKAV